MGKPTPIDFAMKQLGLKDYPCLEQPQLFKTAIDANTVDGLFLEFGLYLGNTAKSICTIKPSRVLYGFESFRGIEEFVCDNTNIGTNTYVGELPQYHPNIRLIVGRIEESLPIFLEKYKEPIAFINFDIASGAVKYALETLAKANRLKAGTTINLGHAIKEGENNNGKVYDTIYQAFKTFSEDVKLRYEYIAFGDVHIALKITKDVL